MTIALAHLDLPAWAVMWSVAFVIYLLLKVTTWLDRTKAPVAGWKHAAYLLAWPGMDANRFLNAERIAIKRPSTTEWIFALLKTGFGMCLVAILPKARFERFPYLDGLVEMIGIIFCLHFGLFHLLSLTWRRCGLNAEPIMNWPIKSESLSEFWGRRWNRAFRDVTHRFLFVPLVPRLGPLRAIVVAFLVSGLVHDVVISLPVGAGLGGPTCFFLLQAAGILIERSRMGRRFGLGHGLSGRLCTALFLLAPLPLLFHEPFACNVIVPFVDAMRGTT